DARKAVVKGITVETVPHRKRYFLSRLQNPQHFTNPIYWRWEEHHAEAAECCVKAFAREREAVGSGNLESKVSLGPLRRHTTCSFDQAHNGIDACNCTGRAHDVCHTQGGFARPGGDVKHGATRNNLCVLDERFRDGSEQLPKDFAMPLPKGRRPGPSANDLILLRHRSSSSEAPE